MAYGFNFRATSGYVTDSSGQTYSLGTVYPETRNGITFGWNSALAGNSRDRSTSAPGAPELAGIIYWTNSVNAPPQCTFTVDLPQAGDWTINLALGDATAQQTQFARLKDGSTTFQTLTNVVTNAGEFLDASGVVRTTAALWKSNNVAVSRTFTTTTFNLEIGDLSFVAGNNTTPSHLMLTYVGPPPSTRLPQPSPARQGLGRIHYAMR
jgi:hypothetical protein